MDRHRLQYLNAVEIFHCAYCSYANGLIAYMREIAARTETNWCPIKHQKQTAATHDLYGRFFDCGDGR